MYITGDILTNLLGYGWSVNLIYVLDGATEVLTSTIIGR